MKAEIVSLCTACMCREMEDAATARQMMQEEMLQIEREKVRHVMQDEVSARCLCLQCFDTVGWAAGSASGP